MAKKQIIRYTNISDENGYKEEKYLLQITKGRINFGDYVLFNIGIISEIFQAHGFKKNMVFSGFVGSPHSHIYNMDNCYKITGHYPLDGAPIIENLKVIRKPKDINNF